MSELPAQHLLFEVIAILKALAIPHAVMGGFAVRHWAIPRPTYDADILIQLEPSSKQPLFAALEAADFSVPQEFLAGYEDTLAGMHKIKITKVLGHHLWDVDLFFARSDFLRAAMARRQQTTLGDVQAEVLSVEDLVLLKLLAYRLKDRVDIQDMLLLNPTPDMGYLNHWASQLGLEDRLGESLADMDL